MWPSARRRMYPGGELPDRTHFGWVSTSSKGLLLAHPLTKMPAHGAEELIERYAKGEREF